MNEIYKNGIYHLDSNLKHAADWFINDKLNTYVYKYAYFTYPTFDVSTVQKSDIIRYVYYKIITILNWFSGFKDHDFIYKYIHNEKTKTNDILDLQIYDTKDYFIAFYFKKIFKMIFIEKNDKNNNYIYIYKVPQIFVKTTIYKKNELLKIISNDFNIKLITNYIKNNF